VGVLPVLGQVNEGGNEVTKYLKADGTLSDTEVKLTLNDFEHDKGTDKYTLTITTSELGSYTVTETTKDVDGKDVTVEYSINGSDRTEGTEAEAAIEAGKTTRVEFQNDYEKEKTFEKKVLRIEPGTQEALPGAVIQLLDESGTVLKEWISSAEEPEILTGLKPSKTYTIHEIAAPEGYPLAPDSKFVLKEDGSIDEKNSNATEGPDGTLLLTEPEDKPEAGTLKLIKTIEGNITAEEFEGALTFEVKTEDGKWLDKDGKISETEVKLTLKDGGFVKGEDGTYTKTFEIVAPGKYTVVETNSDVEGYKLVVDKSVTEGNATVEAGKTAAIELKDVYEKTEETPGENPGTEEDGKKDDDHGGSNGTNPGGTSTKDDDNTGKKPASSTVKRSSSSGGGSAKSSAGTRSRGSVGTGDDTDVATPAITAILALGAILAILRRKRNQNME
jgi:hypothetical protein